MQEDFSQAALVLIGHGSSRNADSGVPVFQHASELRRRRVFAQVREGFWKQDPLVVRVVPELKERTIFLVPLFISEGFFSENVIPQALGFRFEGAAISERLRREGNQILIYARPVGSHPSMTEVLLTRAQGVVAQFPFPRAPKPRDITLFIAGHGTEQNEKSREAVEHQVELIRGQNIYADVQAIFLEEDPRIPTCYERAQTRNIVIVPFFISDGMHVQEDIPVMLGEPARIVQQRLEARQATWRNPTEKKGKLVWLASSVGTEKLMADVIMERVREAAGWAGGSSKSEGGKKHSN
jgi:sirohydrochlorin cobaltochelatase